MPRLFPLDGTTLAYRAHFAMVRSNLTTPEGQPSGATYGFALTLRELLEDEKPEHIAVAFDPPGPTVRHKRSKDYKATREKIPDELVGQLPWLRDLVRAYGIAIYEVPGFEDAPTRESCTIRRASTNTPLQALVLWNDEQYVEAARVLGERMMKEPVQTDSERLAILVRRCTGRAPDREESERLAAALGAFRERFSAAVADAKSLIAVGAQMADPQLDPVELAAWTMVSSAVLNLDATITKS